MFLNLNKLSKLAKEAYKLELIIGLVMIAAGKLTNENLSGALATVDFSEKED